MEVCMAYRPANHRTEHGILIQKVNVRKDWKHSVWQKSQQCCQETLCAFLDNSPKILRLVRKL